MKGHSRPRTRAWMLPAGVAALIAAHGVLYYVLSHMALAAVVVSGVVILVVVKHLGLLGPLYALVRRRSRQLKPGDPVPCGRDLEHRDNEPRPGPG